jgi:NADH-quinone oxidoreductase subunit L
MHDEQDIQKMGGLKKHLPVTYATFLVAAVAISGIPPLAGFFSKDEILWKAFSSEYGSPLFWVIGVLVAACTAFYMFRLVSLTFEGEERFDHHQVHPHEATGTMTIPLIILAGLSIVGGWIGIPESLFGGNALEHWLDPVFESANEKLRLSQHEVSAVEYVLMTLSVLVAAGAIWGARILYLKRRDVVANLQQRFAGIHRILFNKYYVDEVYDATIITPTVRLSESLLWKWIDVRFIDGIVNGSAEIIDVASQWIRRIQTGVAQLYAIVFVGGILVILMWILFKQP